MCRHYVVVVKFGCAGLMFIHRRRSRSRSSHPLVKCVLILAQWCGRSVGVYRSYVKWWGRLQCGDVVMFVPPSNPDICQLGRVLLNFFVGVWYVILWRLLIDFGLLRSYGGVICDDCFGRRPGFWSRSLLVGYCCRLLCVWCFSLPRGISGGPGRTVEIFQDCARFVVWLRAKPLNVDECMYLYEEDGSKQTHSIELQYLCHHCPCNFPVQKAEQCKKRY